MMSKTSLRLLLGIAEGCNDMTLKEAFQMLFFIVLTKDSWVENVWEQRGDLEGGFMGPSLFQTTC